jgi:hypothetical protein
LLFDLLGTASANLRPTKLNIFASIPGAEISRQRSFIHPARRTSHHLHASYTLLALGSIHRTRSGSSSAAQTAVRLHLPGTTVGSTPCGSRQPLSGDLFKNLQRPSETHDNRCQSTLSTLHYSSESRDRRNLDEKKASWVPQVPSLLSRSKRQMLTSTLSTVFP